MFALGMLQLHAAPERSAPARATMLRRGTTAPIARPGPSRSGRQLDETTRRRAEAHLGRDFASIRVHTDSAAAQRRTTWALMLSRSGQTSPFAQGRYTP